MMEVWGSKTLKANPETMKKLSIRRLIANIKRNMNLLNIGLENNFNFDGVADTIERLILDYIIEQCKYLHLEMPYVETSINYETRNVDTKLTFDDYNLEVSFYVEER